jgi:hypothetical protein
VICFAARSATSKVCTSSSQRPHESEERGCGLSQADRVIEAALPIETLEKFEHRMHLDLEGLGLDYLATRQSAEQLDGALGYVCNPGGIVDELRQLGARRSQRFRRASPRECRGERSGRRL